MISIVVDRRAMDNLQKSLERIPYQFQKDEVMMQIFRRASKPVLSTAKSMFNSRSSVYANDPSWDGTVHRPLAQAMDKHFSARKSKDGTILRVGVVNKDAGRLGWMADHGSADRTTYSGRNTGRMKTTNFFRDAVISTESKVVQNIYRLADAEIDKYIKKNIKI